MEKWIYWWAEEEAKNRDKFRGRKNVGTNDSIQWTASLLLSSYSNSQSISRGGPWLCPHQAQGEVLIWVWISVVNLISIIGSNMKWNLQWNWFKSKNVSNLDSAWLQCSTPSWSTRPSPARSWRRTPPSSSPPSPKCCRNREIEIWPWTHFKMRSIIFIYLYMNWESLDELYAWKTLHMNIWCGS